MWVTSVSSVSGMCPSSCVGDASASEYSKLHAVSRAANRATAALLRPPPALPLPAGPQGPDRDIRDHKKITDLVRFVIDSSQVLGGVAHLPCKMAPLGMFGVQHIDAGHRIGRLSVSMQPGLFSVTELRSNLWVRKLVRCRCSCLMWGIVQKYTAVKDNRYAVQGCVGV